MYHSVADGDKATMPCVGNGGVVGMTGGVCVHCACYNGGLWEMGVWIVP